MELLRRTGGTTDPPGADSAYLLTPAPLYYYEQPVLVPQSLHV